MKGLTNDRKPTTNRLLTKLAVQCSIHRFLVNQSLVLCINICGENRQHQQEAKKFSVMIKLLITHTH